MAGRALKLSPEDEARVRQDVVSSTHRAFDARGFGLRTLPGFLAECIRERVWERERKLEGGGHQGPVPFVDFITKPYPVGIGASLDALDPIVASNADLAAEWETLTGRVVGPRKLPLAKIRRDGGTQVRAEMSASTVADYSSRLDELPPVDVFDDGSENWLADGFHRCEAFESSGATEIPCVVRKGTRRDAVLFAVGANTKHGLPRSNADKRRAVEMLLADEEWRSKSDRWIAEACGVGNQLVGHVRSQLCDSHSSTDEPRTGKDGKKRRLPEPKPEPRVQRAEQGEAEPQEISFDGDLGPAPEPLVAAPSRLVTDAFRLVERMTPTERQDFARQIQPLLAAAEGQQ